MIGWLRGRVVDRQADGDIVVDVGGVGYRVTVVPALMAQWGPGGEAVELHVHTHVREDALVLYGFATAGERRCFEILLGAHGVGPSLALGMIAALGAEGLARAVAEDDVALLCSVPGVGRKTAARLVLDLQHKLDGPVTTSATMAIAEGDGAGRSSRGDVRVALAELGYGPDEVRHALSGLDEDGAPVEELLRRALRQLAGAR